MIQAWQLVATVQEKFRGLPARIAAMNGKTAEWYSSHSREPKTQNPMASGNVSEVEHYMRYCRKYEGAIRGAGRYLNSLIHSELEAEFADRIATETNQAEMECEVIDEVTDVSKWLIRFDIANASRVELLDFERQCDEAVNSVEHAKAQARARRRMIEAGTNLREFAKQEVRGRV